MSECICVGNWRALVKKCEPLIDKRFRDQRGRRFVFFGLVHGSDDYYYGMSSKKWGIRLLSCVGTLEAFGFTRLPEPQTSTRTESP